jgi:AraC family transcriptional regulator of arabinose operon
MDNVTETASVLRNAKTTWRLIRGQAVGKEELHDAWLSTTGDHPGNIAERLGPLLLKLSRTEFFTAQPLVPQLISKWRPKFESATALSVEQAICFQVEAGGALEHLSGLLGDNCLSAVTHMERDTPSDVVTRRPAGNLSGWSLNLSVSGVGQYNCIRQEFRAGPGDMVLLSPEAMYDYQRAPEASCWVHSWIYFKPDQNLLRWLNWAEIGPHIYHLKPPASELSSIKSLFDSTLEFDPTESKQSEALLLNITEQIFIRCAMLPADSARNYMDARVKRAMSFIGDNLERALTVDCIAQHVQLSKTQLSALFKEYTGSTLINWREERRVARASQLLTQTTLQIQEVAQRVGYDDPLYFSRTFSKLIGCSPRQFRQIRQPSVEGKMPT